MRDALKLFEERVKADCGLALNRSKSEFYIPSLPVATQEAPAMLRAGLAEGRDGGHRGVLCVGIPLGTDAYVEHVAQRKAAAAKSKITTILDQLLPSEPQAAQTLAYYCLCPLVDYLVQALPPRLARAMAADFDSHLFAALVPRVLPAEMATDPLLRRRLRLPVRLCGGALRERGGWLCDVAYVAQLLRVLPAMTDHAPEAGAGEQRIPGFAHGLLEPLLGGDLAHSVEPFARLMEGDSELATEFRQSWLAVQAAAGQPGHFNEASEGLLSLIRAMAKATSKCRHRQLGYKSALGGVRPAQARLMRRLGIAAARANAHHLIVARHSIGRVSSVAAQERARTGAAREGAETSDEDFHRTGSRFEPEGERARQAAGEDYGRPAESEYAAEHESARTA